MPNRTSPDQKPQSDDDQVVGRLIDALATETGAERDQAYASLVRMESRAVPLLIGGLNHADSTARFYVVRALANIRDSRAIEPLIITDLNDEDEEVRAEA